MDKELTKDLDVITKEFLADNANSSYNKNTNIFKDIERGEALNVDDKEVDEFLQS